MLGLSKKQWQFILIAVALVLLVNYLDIWHHFSYYEIRSGNEKWCKYRWGELIFKTINTGLLLSALTWLLVFVSKIKFLQRLPSIVKYGIELLVSVFTGVFFAVTSISFSTIQIYTFWCGFLSGYLESPHVTIASKIIVFPVVSVLTFRAMYISNRLEENTSMTKQEGTIQNLGKPLISLGSSLNRLVLFNWLVPLVIILSPTLLSLVTAHLGLRVLKLPLQEVLQGFGYIVLPSASRPTVLLLPSVIPLFLCIIPFVRKKLGQRSVMTLAVVFSILSSLSLWAGLSTARFTAGEYTGTFIYNYTFNYELVDFVVPAYWVYFITGCGIALIVLNFIVIIGRGRTE